MKKNSPDSFAGAYKNPVDREIQPKFYLLFSITLNYICGLFQVLFKKSF